MRSITRVMTMPGHPGPFRAGPGGLPPCLAGRGPVQAACRAFLAEVRRGCPPPREIVFYGPRGNGKTALLVWIEDARVPGRRADRVGDRGTVAPLGRAGHPRSRDTDVMDFRWRGNGGAEIAGTAASPPGGCRAGRPRSQDAPTPGTGPWFRLCRVGLQACSAASTSDLVEMVCPEDPRLLASSLPKGSRTRSSRGAGVAQPKTT